MSKGGGQGSYQQMQVLLIVVSFLMGLTQDLTQQVSNEQMNNKLKINFET